MDIIHAETRENILSTLELTSSDDNTCPLWETLKLDVFTSDWTGMGIGKR